MDILEWLERWYLSQCNGAWEHEYVIRLESLDNPGWGVFIPLKHTDLQDRTFTRIERERTESDWLHCWVENGRFEGAGGPQNLREMLGVFRDWAESQK